MIYKPSSSALGNLLDGQKRVSKNRSILSLSQIVSRIIDTVWPKFLWTRMNCVGGRSLEWNSVDFAGHIVNNTVTLVLEKRENSRELTQSHSS